MGIEPGKTGWSEEPLGTLCGELKLQGKQDVFKIKLYYDYFYLKPIYAVPHSNAWHLTCSEKSM